MSAACFARFSLPLHLLPPLSRSAAFARSRLSRSFLSRNVPSAAALLSPPKPRALSLVFTGSIFASRRPMLLRSMTSEASSEEDGVPKSVPVNVAHELLKAGHRYLDVRTVEEFTSGHAVGAVNIPYMFRSGSGMSKNPNFVPEVTSTFAKDENIIVGCLSGRRSLMAASELKKAGFTGITDSEGGYSAWSQNGLPTEQ